MQCSHPGHESSGAVLLTHTELAELEDRVGVEGKCSSCSGEAKVEIFVRATDIEKLIPGFVCAGFLDPLSEVVASRPWLVCSF